MTDLGFLILCAVGITGCVALVGVSLITVYFIRKEEFVDRLAAKQYGPRKGKSDATSG